MKVEVVVIEHHPESDARMAWADKPFTAFCSIFPKDTRADGTTEKEAVERAVSMLKGMIGGRGGVKNVKTVEVGWP
jgi:hypothetical protein